MSTNVLFFQIVLSILKSFKTICGRITFAFYKSFNKVLAKEHVTVLIINYELLMKTIKTVMPMQVQGNQGNGEFANSTQHANTLYM